MQETELHDLSDDSDYAASLQHGSASLTRSDSSKRSSASEPDGALVVYLKDNVAVHPTQYASERISGRLRLINQGSSLFMTWIPYKGQSSNARLSDRDRNLYTIRAVPFTDIRSIRRHTPPLGWQYIIVVLSSGLAFPPLYFYNGGVREFFATVKQHVSLLRSAEDSSVFLVNDFQDRLQRTLSSLELPMAVSVANGLSSAISVGEFPSNENQERNEGGSFDGSSSHNQHNGRQRQKVHGPARDIPIQVLEKFSRVTRLARETTSQLFRESHSDGFGANERKHDNQTPHDSPRNSVSSDVEKVSSGIPIASENLEKIPSRKRDDDEEAATNVGTFELIDSKEVLKVSSLSMRIGSLSMRIRVSSSFWDIAFHNSLQVAVTQLQPLEFKQEKDIKFKQEDLGILRMPNCLFDKLTLVWGKPRQPPLCSEEWSTFFDSKGRIVDSRSLRKRVFYGGVDHRIRKEVWPFLLGYHACDSTQAERQYLVSVKKSEYETIKNQWQSISAEQAKRFTKFRERRGLIEKDVVRTDRSLSFYDGDDNPNVILLRDILLTYSLYNFDLGYCQGMSDLLSPILFVLRDESESFWCFVALMERLGPNFNRDQSGMHSQLFALSKLVELLDSPLHNYFMQNDCLNYFFCFRWLLIQFKREFEFHKTMRLWEVLWTHYLSEHLHLYFGIAILKRYRPKIIEEQMDFDTLLKFINELSGQIDLEATLKEAEALCICAGENGAAIIPPGTPPALPIENGVLYPQLDDEVL